jgi:hypothetical protein
MNILASTVCDTSRTALAQSFIACSLFRTETVRYNDDDDWEDGDEGDHDEDPDSVVFIIPVNVFRNAAQALLSALVVVVVLPASAPTPAFTSVLMIPAFASSFRSAGPASGAHK